MIKITAYDSELKQQQQQITDGTRFLSQLQTQKRETIESLSSLNRIATTLRAQKSGVQEEIRSLELRCQQVDSKIDVSNNKLSVLKSKIIKTEDILPALIIVRECLRRRNCQLAAENEVLAVSVAEKQREAGLLDGKVFALGTDIKTIVERTR